MPDLLLVPATGLALLLTLIYTLGVHLFMGLGYRHMFRHWLLAIGAMAAGYGVALRANSHWPTLGDAHVLEGTAAALIVLLLAGFKAKSSTIITQ